jgi:hypothetical protein
MGLLYMVEPMADIHIFITSILIIIIIVIIIIELPQIHPTYTNNFVPSQNLVIPFSFSCKVGICLLYVSLYSLIWDFLLSQINIWTTTTWSNVWVFLPKPSWYEFLIGFFIWTPASKYLHLTTFYNICVILSIFLYL